MLLHHNISLQPYNTFGLDVNGQYVAIITHLDDIEEVYANHRLRPMPKLVLGGGSNVLFTGNQRKVFLKMEIDGIDVVEEGRDDVIVEVGAGVVWHQFVLWCLENDLGGVENLSLIPGTVGAAPIQNIGAYGVEFKKIFHSLDTVEGKTGETKTFLAEECEFGYRYSVFKGKFKGKYIITRVRMRLSKKPSFNIAYGNLKLTLDQMGVEELSARAISEAVIHIRQTKLPDPLDIGNAGSFFKNPMVERPLLEALQEIYPDLPFFEVDDSWSKIPAAWLIEKCGWKGKRRGDIGVHEQQPLVLVNYGGGSGKEIVKLSKDIQKSVSSTFGIDLSPEVNIV